MPTKGLQIATPILLAGQYFDVKYRLLPSGTWTATTITDNAYHLLTGLTAGNYEMTVSLVTGGTSCSIKSYKFKVNSGCDCDTDISIICSRKNGVVKVAITSTVGANPPSLYKLTVTDTTGVLMTSINCFSINASQFSFYDNGDTGFYLRIEVYCGGNMDKTNECYYDILPCFEQPVAPLTVHSSKLVIDGGQMYIQIDTKESAIDVYSGYKETVDPLDSDGIEGGNKQAYVMGSDIVINFANTDPQYQWAAWPAAEEGITGWYVDEFNNGTFGTGELFATPITVGDYTYTQTNFKTTLETVTMIH